jgi:hypothetical protein
MYVNCEADFEFYSKERIHAKVQEGVHEVSIGYRGYIELFLFARNWEGKRPVISCIRFTTQMSMEDLVLKLSRSV